MKFVRNSATLDVINRYLGTVIVNPKEMLEVLDLRSIGYNKIKCGTCPIMYVEIDVTDESPFVIRPFHLKEEDNTILDKEMKRLCYLAIVKGFSAYLILVMLISKKFTNDKRAVTVFRDLNARIGKKTNLLLKDTFSVLENSRCQV